MHANQHAYLTRLRDQGRKYQGMPIPELLPEIDAWSSGAAGGPDVATIVREVLTEIEATKELQELEAMADDQRTRRPKEEKDA